MNIEEFFEFYSPEDIRIIGTRIGIETVLYEYIYREKSPEEIHQIYPDLTLEQIYATVLYYLRNRKEIEQYLSRWLGQTRKRLESQEKNPPDIVRKLRKIKKDSRSEITYR